MLHARHSLIKSFEFRIKNKNKNATKKTDVSAFKTTLFE